MSITISEIEHLAKLARLNLTDEEKERLTGEMAGILQFSAKLDEVDSSNVSPTMHVGNVVNVFREDEVRESLPKKDILKNAPKADDDCFIVPKTVE